MKCTTVALVATVGLTGQVLAGAFLGSGLVASGVTYPPGYSGSGTTLELKVCVNPSSEFAAQMQAPLENSIAVWNALQPTTANLRQHPLPANTFDFESVALHELGHCLGLGHPNLGPGAGIDNRSFAQSNPGADGVYEFNAGRDDVAGTADDVRGDDINTHYSFASNNHPFALRDVVDSSTYTTDVAQLPAADQYAATAGRGSASLNRFAAGNTEAVMVQGAVAGEIQRTLGHDDVATIRFAMSGLDRIQATADDYSTRLVFGGLSNAADCAISVSMDPQQTAFAACSVVPQIATDHIRIITGNIFFNPDIDWYFNDKPPCKESMSLTTGQWHMISLPCQVGVSTPDTLAEVLGDDLGRDRYNIDWVVFAHEYSTGVGGKLSGNYRKLQLEDSMASGQGYWVITYGKDKTISVEGEYHGALESSVQIDAEYGRGFGWNLIGNPYRFNTVWADARVVVEDGSTVSLAEADPQVASGAMVPGTTACTASRVPASDCRVARFAWRYDAAAGDYELLSTLSGRLEPFDALWVYAAADQHAIRLAMPPSELVSP